MKNKSVSDKCIVLLFCLALALLPGLFLLLPRADWSAAEKRFLAPVPRLQASDLLSGRFAEDAERYTADHLPGREALIGLYARFELLSGRNAAREIVRCADGRLVEAPVAADEAVLARHLATLNTFAEAAPCPVDLLLVPSAGAVLGDVLPPLAGPYPDEDLIDDAFSLAGPALHPVALFPVFSAAADPGALYYRSDHHWTSAGAWLACQTYLEAVGRTGLPRDAYAVDRVPGFRGSTYSRAALWDAPSENLELWHSGGSFRVENADSPGIHEGLFYPERLTEDDKYPVFLDGNHSLVRIYNDSEAARGRLLVIRDSFGNSLGGFLADAYEEVVLVDLRYYRKPVSELLADEPFDRVLICYSVGNFMTDASIEKLA